MLTRLAPGFLVAAPSLLDPHFKRAVVLLVEHKDEGSLGFVINQPSAMEAAAIAHGVGLTDDDLNGKINIMDGGPVAPETGWIVFDPSAVDDIPEGTIEVTANVAVSASRAFLIRLLRGEVGTRQMLVLGYAGWGSGQLDEELSHGAWIPVDLSDRVVFDTAFDGRWSAALRNAGIDPGRLSGQAPSEA